MKHQLLLVSNDIANLLWCPKGHSYIFDAQRYIPDHCISSWWTSRAQISNWCKTFEHHYMTEFHSFQDNTWNMILFIILFSLKIIDYLKFSGSRTRRRTEKDPRGIRSREKTQSGVEEIDGCFDGRRIAGTGWSVDRGQNKIGTSSRGICWEGTNYYLGCLHLNMAINSGKISVTIRMPIILPISTDCFLHFLMNPISDNAGCEYGWRGSNRKGRLESSLSVYFQG